MHLLQHKLNTRKMELALEVKFYLDFYWVLWPWRWMLSNGSDVKYVFVWCPFTVASVEWLCSPGSPVGSVTEKKEKKIISNHILVITNCTALFLTLPLTRSRDTFSQPFEEKLCISEVVRIGSIQSSSICVSYEKPRSSYCVVCLVRMQGKFEIDHSWAWKG